MSIKVPYPRIVSATDKWKHDIPHSDYMAKTNQMALGDCKCGERETKGAGAWEMKGRLPVVNFLSLLRGA